MSQRENTHLTPEELAAYLDGDLQPGERERVEAHLADCEGCLDEVAALEHLARERPGGANASRWKKTALALASAAAIVSIFLSLPETSRRTPEELRSPPTAGDPGIVTLDALEPVGEISGTDGIILRWEAATEGALYRVAVLDSVGSVLWNADTRDSTISVPADVRDRLQPGRRYFWRTDALLPDLRTVTTGDQPFRLRP